MDELPGYGRVRNSTREMREVARTLRRAATPAERALWAALRRNQVDGLHFRRQHPVGTFSLDFYCPAAHLAIEVDGSVHDDPDVAIRDALRQEAIERFGCRVLRFRNEEVLGSLSSVLARIRQAIRELDPH